MSAALAASAIPQRQQLWTAQPLESRRTTHPPPHQSPGSGGGTQHLQFPKKPFLWSLKAVVTDAVDCTAQVFCKLPISAQPARGDDPSVPACPSPRLKVWARCCGPPKGDLIPELWLWLSLG